MVNMKTNKSQRRTAGTFNGCRRATLIIFCYDDMLRRGYYLVPIIRNSQYYLPDIMSNVIVGADTVTTRTNRVGYLDWKLFNKTFDQDNPSSSNQWLQAYKDWPLTNLTMDLYQKDRFGNYKKVDARKTDINGYVTFKNVNHGDYYVAPDESELPYPMRDRVRLVTLANDYTPYIEPDARFYIKVSNQSKKDNGNVQRFDVGWCFYCQYKIDDSPRNSCLVGGAGYWLDGVYSSCVCGTGLNITTEQLKSMYTMQHLNTGGNANIVLCGFLQTNTIGPYSLIGHYSGMIVATEIKYLNGHVFGFDTTYENLLGGSTTPLTDLGANGLTVDFSGFIPGFSYKKIQLTTGVSPNAAYAFARALYAINEHPTLQVMIAAHGKCSSTPCYRQQAYYLTAMTKLKTLKFYTSMQPHFEYS